MAATGWSSRSFRAATASCSDPAPARQPASRSYNDDVSSSQRHRPLKLGLLTVLAILLALSPFLHGHLGASHVQGFHLDGLQQALHPASVDAIQQAGISQDESPALGVPSTLPKGDDEGSRPVPSGAALLVLLALLLPRQRARQPRPAFHTPVPARRHAAGWPPPALAPPRLNA